MTLVPLDGVASVVAKIAKQDPETARVYAQLGLYEVLGDIIDVYRPEIDHQVIKSIGAGADLARRALVREFVERRMNGEGVGDLLTAARGLDELDGQIAKAAGEFVEREHRRDPYTGRWVVMLNSPNNQVERAHEAAQVMDEWRRSGLVQHGQQVIVTDADGNQNAHQLKQSLPADRQALESLKNGSGKKAPSFVPHQVELAPSQSTRASGPPGGAHSDQGDLFDAMAYATGSPAAAARVTPSIARTQAGLEDLVGGEHHPAFRTLRAGGAALQAVSVPGSGTHAAGAVAQLSGHLGPEAQRILGPGFARLAYKYRGTERTPDKNLVKDVAQATELADAAGRPVDLPNGAPNPRALRPDNPMKKANLGSAIRAGSFGGMTADQRRLLVRGDAAVAYFIDQMPSIEQAELSIAAGRVPPSVGAIIDADGEVVSEAMGTGEDHYLPFDLKNLKELSGGQYVRTRLAGGPTTEDIYTGLLTGTRQLQVVSHSGVFTLEFDPDLRGGRRYSDKARQMVGRYDAMLRTISEGNVRERDIGPKRMAELRAQAVNRAGGPANFDPETATNEFKRLQSEERSRSNFSGEADEDEVRADALREAKEQVGPQGSSQQLQTASDEIFRTRMNDLKDNEVRNLQLDGVGYFRAMQALKQEFPYFIRDVSWEPMQGPNGFLQARGIQPDNDQAKIRSRIRMKDTGYVREGNITAANWVTARNKADRDKPRAMYRSGQRAAAPPPATENENGGPSGGGAAPVSAGAPERPQPQAAGKYAEEPVGEKVVVPNVSGVVPTKLEDLGKEDSKIAEDAQNALAAVDIALSGTQLGANPTAVDVQNPERVSGAPDYVHAVMNHAGVGPRGAIGYFLKPGHDLPKFIEGLRQIDEDMTAKATSIDPEGKALRDRVPSERFTEAIKNLQLLGRLSKPFSDPSGPVHEHAPANEDAPLRFADVEALGNDTGHYAAFRQAASPRLQAAIAGMERLKPEDRPAAVRKLVSEYKRAQAFSKKDPMSPEEQGLPSGVSTPRQAQIWLQNAPDKDIRAAHKAWAFVHAHEIAAEIAPPKPQSGGGGAPLAPGPTGGLPNIPQYRTGLTVQGHGGGRTPAAKRLDQPRKLIIHPPGSPVAKALARVRSTR